MNWTETRNKLIEIDSKFESLPVEWQPRVNLRGANLSHADLRGAYLHKANLYGADLSESTLYEANLSHADLREANLREVDLYKADLSKAHLNEANLYGADLCGANLYKTVLDEANLIKVDGIITIQFDLRDGYQLVCWQLNSQIMFNASCRSFTYDEALAHWSNDKYEDQKRGLRYVKAIKFLADFAGENI